MTIRTDILRNVLATIGTIVTLALATIAFGHVMIAITNILDMIS